VRDVDGALAVINESNLLPSICGRVCPQESQCEAQCVVGRKLESVAIGRLERFVGDNARPHKAEPPQFDKPMGKVAVVGSGPSGLAVAADLVKLGCDVVTVSRDTQFVHLAWQRSEGELANVKYAMGADVKGDVGRIFGVLDEGSGLTLRGTFVVSPQGKLTNAEVNFFNLGRNMDELLRKVKANIYLATSPAEVCPAKWKSAGDKTLKPSAKMVGKVHEALAAKKK